MTEIAATTPPFPLDGMPLTPPILGRISIGHVETDPDGAVVPVKDDHFSVTTLVQRPDRSWEPHPIQEKLAAGQEKLVKIPVRLAFNDPALTLQRSYACFDNLDPQGRPMCVGNGRVARRMSGAVAEDGVCPRPDSCDLARQYGCRSVMKLYVQIDGQDDDLGVFLLRSGGEASYNSVVYRLNSLAGATGNQLAGMPLTLELKARTTWKPDLEEYFHIDLPFRAGMSMIEAFNAAKTHQEALVSAGMNQAALEDAIRRGRDDARTLDVSDELGDFGPNVIPFPSGTAKRRIKGLDATLEHIRNKTFHVVPLVNSGQRSAALMPCPSISPDTMSAMDSDVDGDANSEDMVSAAPQSVPVAVAPVLQSTPLPPLPYGATMHRLPRPPAMMAGPSVPMVSMLSPGPAVPVFPT